MLSPLLLLGMVMALGLWALDGIHEGGLWEQARHFFPFGEMEAVASGLRRSAGRAAWAGLPWAWDWPSRC